MGEEVREEKGRRGEGGEVADQKLLSHVQT